MVIVVLVLIFLLVLAAATLKFEQSLKQKGGLPRKIFAYIKDLFDALSGLG